MIAIAALAVAVATAIGAFCMQVALQERLDHHAEWLAYLTRVAEEAAKQAAKEMEETGGARR